MKYTFVFILVLLGTASGFGQNVNYHFDENNNMVRDLWSDVEGSPYLITKWTTGEIVSAKNEKFVDVKLRYNSHLDVFEVYYENEGRKIEINKFIYNTISFTELSDDGREDYVFRNQVIEKDFRYFREIYNGEKVALYVRYENPIKENIGDTYGQSAKNRRFAPIKKYFLLENGTLVKFKLNKKGLIKAVGDNRKMERLIKKEKLKIKSVESAAKALSLYEL